MGDRHQLATYLSQVSCNSNQVGGAFTFDAGRSIFSEMLTLFRLDSGEQYRHNKY